MFSNNKPGDLTAEALREARDALGEPPVIRPTELIFTEDDLVRFFGHSPEEAKRFLDSLAPKKGRDDAP